MTSFIPGHGFMLDDSNLLRLWTRSLRSKQNTTEVLIIIISSNHPKYYVYLGLDDDYLKMTVDVKLRLDWWQLQIWHIFAAEWVVNASCRRLDKTLPFSLYRINRTKTLDPPNQEERQRVTYKTTWLPNKTENTIVRMWLFSKRSTST